MTGIERLGRRKEKRRDNIRAKRMNLIFLQQCVRRIDVKPGGIQESQTRGQYPTSTSPAAPGVRPRGRGCTCSLFLGFLEASFPFKLNFLLMVLSVLLSFWLGGLRGIIFSGWKFNGQGQVLKVNHKNDAGLFLRKSNGIHMQISIFEGCRPEINPEIRMQSPFFSLG